MEGGSSLETHPVLGGNQGMAEEEATRPRGTFVHMDELYWNRNNFHTVLHYASNVSCLTKNLDTRLD